MENGRKKLFLLCLLLVACGLTALFAGPAIKEAPSAPSLVVTDEAKYSSGEKQQKEIVVYVSGAVARPGLYKLPKGARAQEALLAAGGLTNQAQGERVNLAKLLTDGAHVYVPEAKAAKAASRTALREPVQKIPQGKSSLKGKAPSKAGPVSLNSATLEELTSLPGIGPAMAKRILAYRQQQPFTQIEDLLQVSGIGPAKLAKLRHLVVVE